MASPPDHDLPVGPSLGDWQPPLRPAAATLHGQWVSLQPLAPAIHAEALWQALSADPVGRLWTYLSAGPFASATAFRDWLDSHAADASLLNHVVVPNGSEAAGLASYLRIEPAMGSIEIGHLLLAPCLQQTRAATEALHLLIEQAFALGYRRVEWKCDHLNAASRRAAERLGFRFEGVHRQARVYKGRSRDTAWFSIIDSEWPALRASHLAWLHADNFDAAGRQRRSLAECRPEP